MTYRVVLADAREWLVEFETTAMAMVSAFGGYYHNINEDTLFDFED